jgi:hypothetical protein
VSDLVIDPRFRGPPNSANGGYTCGLLAQFVDAAAAEVTLRKPPPLGRTLTIEERGDAAVLLDGDELIAEGVPSTLDLQPPRIVDVEEARDAERGYVGADDHPFPTCFVCGPARDCAHALCLRPGRVRDERLVATVWTPREPVVHELVWAALDCPGAFAVELGVRGLRVLGRLTAQIDLQPWPGEEHVIVGWPLESEGRKHGAGTALIGPNGLVFARARAVWIDV